MTDITQQIVGTEENKSLGYIAGALMLVCAPAGVILSYIDRGKATPLLAAHYSYLIGTFWKGMLFLTISIVLTFVIIGIFASILTSIWYLIRCIKSLVYLHRGEAIAKPSTWLI
ncbi:hypothetical protein PZ897_14300 [Hoeflea sp. YIM 152468]|uniref:DUF4870 family protein n=1 Tax=Hoeflea sp. YIM 152468 TaxID=3031759 RepID=UPI0023DB1EB9|nr:hypothetical protein [Hoeflea sp. YIM 152468]MDF1609354.1 hypothetical protein [Hoeflea sp. YIM 152468]